MDDIFNLSGKISPLKSDIQNIDDSSEDLSLELEKESSELDLLENRISLLFNKIGKTMPKFNEENDSLREFNDLVDSKIIEGKTSFDKAFDLNAIDVLIASLAGGLSVLLDFLVVKIPKDMKTFNGKDVNQKGSPLTKFFKSIGVDENGNESKWVKNLEKWFHVDYDKSITEDIPGMYPKNHRIFSLGHDFSLSGLLWGIHDIILGKFSYIDKEGVLHIDDVAPSDFKKILYAPILWLGHIISDVFTKQGIPVPGACILRLFQLGDFGTKHRTVGDIVEYMYVQGYDLRHMLTTSICNKVIDIVVSIYMYFTEVGDLDRNNLFCEREYVEVMNERKKRKIMFIAYSIAVAGNIGKIASNQGNPLAINVSTWINFAKEAISQIIIKIDDSKFYIEAIQNSHLIDENFERLFMKLDQLKNH